MLKRQPTELERRLVERINEHYLLPRKSSELMESEGTMPLVATPEVRQFAEESMRNKNIDTAVESELIGWERFWAQEKAAAMTIMAHGGGYISFLAGRSLHYEQLVHALGTLFEGNGHKGIVGKSIVELGSGSSLGLISLAQQHAKVTGLDQSVMAHELAKYLAGHYRVGDKLKLQLGNYFNTGFTDGEFDMAINSGVLEHEETKKACDVIGEMARIVRPGGYVVIAVPNEQGPFYRRFKKRQKEIEKNHPQIARNPVEHKRYPHDIAGIMESQGLVVVRQDGLQVAPSSPIEPGDISPDHQLFFNEYLPRNAPTGIDAKVAVWSRLEMNATPDMRKSYGWSVYTVGQKPIFGSKR